MRILLHIKRFIFRNLFIKILSFILNQMLFHYFKIINHNIKLCIKQFIIIMKLLYTYIMKQRILKAIEILKIENIYSH